VLGVLGADPAVVRAASVDLSLPLQGLIARLAEALDLEIACGVAVHDRLGPPVRGTGAGQNHPPVPLDQLRVKHAAAARADRFGASERRRLGGGCWMGINRLGHSLRSLPRLEPEQRGNGSG
jgi:hypothetical protein